MNFKATDASIAAQGGYRPCSQITARPVTAIKAGPVAHTLTGQHTPNKNAVNSANGGTATDRSGKTICHALISVLGAEKAGACRSQSIFYT